jgi:hypothetical protein
MGKFLSDTLEVAIDMKAADASTSLRDTPLRRNRP